MAIINDIIDIFVDSLKYQFELLNQHTHNNNIGSVVNFDEEKVKAEFMNAWNENLKRLNEDSKPWYQSSTQEEKTTCNHDLKEYNGFTESYKYCTKCDHKE